jgi:hypothetical protein
MTAYGLMHLIDAQLPCRNVLGEGIYSIWLDSESLSEPLEDRFGNMPSFRQPNMTPEHAQLAPEHVPLMCVYNMSLVRYRCVEILQLLYAPALG